MGLKEAVVAGHREDIPEVLAALDVVVSASTAAEGVPQVLVQALAMERPVMALLNDPAKASAMASAGRRLVKQDYSLEGVVNKLEVLYRLVLQERGFASQDAACGQGRKLPDG